jgi:hypothetical protein
MKKALIKKTGEILDVVHEYSLMNIEIKLPEGIDSELVKQLKDQWKESKSLHQVEIRSGKDREDFYTLSDGKTYELEELVVELDEIREWKIKNNLKIN